MSVLDQVMTMKKQGFGDSDIVNNLTQQRISPREINDALKQAEIKNAVSDYDYKGSGMEPSIMQEGESYAPYPEDQQESTYQPQEYAPQQQQQYNPQEYTPQETQQYQQGYEQYAPAPSPALDTDTIMEISDQIFSDRIKKFQKVLDATSEAAVVLQSKFENVSERLKKIETMIDKLQIAILEKVGSYGQNLESVKKEMSMMQDSFSKMVAPKKETKRQVGIPEEHLEEIPKKISKKKI